MKKITFLAILAMCFMVSGISFAQENAAEETSMSMDKEMKKPGMMKKKGSMHGMMMKKMMQKEMVATEDGGVIVLIGNKLMKYDKDLNLVKEVEIKWDMEAMKKRMKECMNMMGEDSKE